MEMFCFIASHNLKLTNYSSFSWKKFVIKIKEGRAYDGEMDVWCVSEG